MWDKSQELKDKIVIIRFIEALWLLHDHMDQERWRILNAKLRKYWAAEASHKALREIQ